MHVDQLYTNNLPLVKRKAVEGDAQFQLILGMMYNYGEGVFKNKEKAQFWIGKSASSGNKVAKTLERCIHNESAFNRVISEHLEDLPFVKMDEDYRIKRRVNVRKLIGYHYGKGIIGHMFQSIAKTVNPKYATTSQITSFRIFTILFVVLLLGGLILSLITVGIYLGK